MNKHILVCTSKRMERGNLGQALAEETQSNGHFSVIIGEQTQRDEGNRAAVKLVVYSFREGVSKLFFLLM